MDTLFNIEMYDVPEPPEPEINFKYFLLAYWRDGWWKIFPNIYKSENCEEILQKIKDLRNAGWKYIKICKLP